MRKRKAGYGLLLFAFLLIAATPVFSQDEKEKNDAQSVEWNQKGIEFLNKGEFDSSIQAFHKALQFKSDDKIIRKNLAIAYYQQGQSQIEKKWYEGAVTSFRNAAEIDTETSRYPLYIGYTFYIWGNLSNAVDELNRTIAKFPNEAEAYRLLGEIYYGQTQHEKAVQNLEKALALISVEKKDEKDEEKTARKKKMAEIQAFLDKVKKDQKVEKNFTPDSSDHFDFLYDVTERGDLMKNASAIARDLEDAYATVGAHFGVYPEKRFQVLFYEPKEFSETTSVDNWVGGVFDGKIRIPVRDYNKEKARIRQTIFHEYTHAVVYTITAECPVWINEGLAQLEEGMSVPAAEKRLKEHPEKLLTAAEFRASFVQLNAEKARIAYDMALSFTKRLLDQYGFNAVTNYLRKLSEGKEKEQEIFKSVFGLPLDEHLARWKEQTGL